MNGWLLPGLVVLWPVERETLRRLGGLRILRGVAEGVAEEARIRSFASPAFAGFAFFLAYSLT